MKHLNLKCFKLYGQQICGYAKHLENYTTSLLVVTAAIISSNDKIIKDKCCCCCFQLFIMKNNTNETNENIYIAQTHKHTHINIFTCVEP